MAEDSELYARTAGEYAEQAEFWTRRAQRTVRTINVPAIVSITLALSLLITCLLVWVVKAQILHQLETHPASCQTSASSRRT